MRPLVMVLLAALISGCASIPPSNQDNLCQIYRQKPDWYAESVQAAKRWKSSIYVPMAIMAQESSFRARARPPMRYFLGFIPYGRASNAFGYPQALNSTWAAYRKEAGRTLARRSNFGDAVDFIQWYMNTTTKINGVPKTNAYAQYLNYHEGQGGYRRGTYKNKQWLVNTARRVESRAVKYRQQLASCKPELDKGLKKWFFF